MHCQTLINIALSISTKSHKNRISTRKPILINQLKRILKVSGWSYCYYSNRFIHKERHDFGIMPDLEYTGYWNLQYFEKKNDFYGNDMECTLPKNYMTVNVRVSNIYELLRKLIQFHFIQYSDIRLAVEYF